MMPRRPRPGFERVLAKSGKHDREIATGIEPAGTFWEGEDYHQKYFERMNRPSILSGCSAESSAPKTGELILQAVSHREDRTQTAVKTAARPMVTSAVSTGAASVRPVTA